MFNSAELHKLLDGHSLLASFSQTAHHNRLWGFINFKNPENLDGALDRLRAYANQLDAFGLDVAARHSRRVVDLLSGAKSDPTYGGVSVSGEEFNDLKRSFDYLHNGSLAFEAESKKFLVLRTEQTKYLADDFSLFGKAVENAFPSVTSEATEAAKCFGFSRWTASAFHAIRCLEVGIRAVSRCLGIPDPIKGPDRNWSAMQRKVKEALDTRWPTAADKVADDYKFFDRLYGALAAFQNPYRNETMHLESSYDEAQAAHIIAMVKGFLSQVATRCDEDGKPTA
ncbi:hypothetical protein [Qipengyuania sp. ASV99]|uniref:hypothetical protein n=1 Tax=Qipengyuania sp. ASV99 TaxID=3399681 RepID=UPI003A4C5F1C